LAHVAGAGGCCAGSGMIGVFYARFDDVVGPVVECQAPTGELALDPELFDRTNEFVIARKELCGSVLTVGDGPTSGKKVMSCPQCVESEKYNRNTFFFAFGFVLSAEESTGGYEPVLQKLSHTMLSLEIESSFLSEGGKDKLQSILDRVLDELSHFGECIVSIDSANTLALKITPRLIDPPEVLDYDVPVQTRDISRLATREWDLTFLQILGFINGERHVKLIAELSGVGVALVRRCIRQLMYYRCVRLVDIFQYSNSYMCTSRIINLGEDERLQKQCISYVWNGVGEPPQPQKVFQLYSSLQPCLELKDFYLLYDTTGLNIDERKFVSFGVLHGIIRRVHKYPVFGNSSLTSDQIEDAEEAGYVQFCDNVQAFFDQPTPSTTIATAVGFAEAPSSLRLAQPDLPPPEHWAGEKEDGSFLEKLDKNSLSTSLISSSSSSSSLSSSPIGFPLVREDSSLLATVSSPPSPASFLNQKQHSVDLDLLQGGEAGEPGGQNEFLEILPLLNGRICFDGNCCELWRGPEELQFLLRAQHKENAHIAMIEK